MNKYLVVVDMQNDFVDGTLGTPEAQAIIKNSARKIADFDGSILVTFDTHQENYLETAEGKKLPVKHCIYQTDGWKLNETILNQLAGKEVIKVIKNTFGSVDLPQIINEKNGSEDLSIELMGLCTDICVISNALILKANFPESKITVDASCCAGVTPELHKNALQVMRSCQIDVINEN